jgi:NDP-sugar pyrophosphorylase family protein
MKKKANLPIDAVIMAGGRGSRLRPLTDSVPKPLLKVGGKPIIEYNVERLNEFGIKSVHISINYLGDQLIEYFGDGEEIKMPIYYITEDTPLGTIGAVASAKNLTQEYVLVMNSDLLTNINFEDFFMTFVDGNADMIVATTPYQVNIPYAVMELDGNKVLSFKEKPTVTYYSNAGIYLFKRSLVSSIPVNEFFNATDLMQAVIKAGKRLIHYPIKDYWLDIGKHEDFEKAQEDIKVISF